MMERTTSASLRQSISLEGKVALVVGGYGAIGTGISEMLASAGAFTVVTGRDGERARELATQLAKDGYPAEGRAFDACDVGAVRHHISDLAEQCGSIDILVNCTGFNKEQPLLDVTEEAFDEVYSRTLRPGMFLSQAVATHQIRDRRGGSQIHLLSIRSFLGFRNRGYSSFCAAKGGLAALIKQQATELASYGITVNGVAPGLVRTRKNEKSFESPEIWERAVADIPLGRLATPSDVAGAVLFFASSYSRFATGQILHVDGGVTACT
ncbi:SDR family NAD(P)-dependent oxidoreductase [Sinorhizobium meliloti]|uniref:SDR family NAD(P)-dependent oxidoreductase n=1 Tax=Rhizobium meliloti TaxID=382 RepID=UPI000376748E|nr:SDR family NAD(P)-dependent oxidoreductase [Sinorhizobium meliloti]MDE3878759.1 SDR family oxidoreductase [Sinorhizobium meliloti]MDE4604557.1 SDR family oxidoreductase [Sinorhizobium meliloti]MDX0315166.1 SDR family oxidoreductase [Sinorhizobium meliloti]UDU21118.1 SDR family oxidoreductase [Sinorhizobium meliloti]